MSRITKLLSDATNVGNLGNLPVKGRPNVTYVPRDGSGTLCYKNGKKGKMKVVNGRPQCVVSNDEDVTMEQDLAEALKGITEAKGLRFASNSRTQIGKQYRLMNDHAIAVQGLGRSKVSPIQGTPGNWFFTVTSNQENQFLDTAKMNGKLYAGVTVATMAGESQQQIDKLVQESPRSAVERMVKETMEALVK